MNKKEYLNKRNALLDEINGLIESGEIENANAKMKEVEQLDADFENAAVAAANLEALKGKNAIPQNAAANLMNLQQAGTEPENTLDSKEYRTAFMNFVLNKTPMPSEFTNANANTKTSDVGPAISPFVVQRIIEKVESSGYILPLVTRTNYAAGMVIPTSNVKPVATWVAEGATSNKQKKTLNGTITFNYFKLRCAISMSLETTVVTLDMFERTFVAQVSEAMVKALEASIISGEGTSSPKGILAETGTAISIKAATGFNYKTLCQIEAAIPGAYEAGTLYCCTKKTFMEIQSITDQNGQPIARVNYGIGGTPERTILGRRVVIADEYMKSLSASSSSGDCVLFAFRFSDYILNMNMNMVVKQYEDNDTEDKITKAVLLADGKVVDDGSLVKVVVSA